MRHTDFDRLYQGDPDPFQVATSWYERRKEAVLLAGLTKDRYATAWDCACGTGHLSLALAGRCDRVVATDASATAVGLTEQRTADSPGVHCWVSRLPDRAAGTDLVDLTVVSEVLYYLPDEDRAQTRAMLADQRGELVCAHWRHHPHDAYLSGEAANNELDKELTGAGWVPAWRHDDTDFVMACWRCGA